MNQEDSEQNEVDGMKKGADQFNYSLWGRYGLVI